MTSQTSSSPAPKRKEENKQSKSRGVVQTAEKDIKPVAAFFTKLNNDWVMNFAAGLAYNILTAIVPIVIAIVSITGLVVGHLAPSARTQLISSISNIFPSTLSSNGQNVLAPVLVSLSKNAGILGIIALLLALFGGSRLFVTLEGYFDIIYHTRPRNVIRQNIMAVIMMLIFVVLVPLMVFAGSGPALVYSLIKATPLGNVPGIDLLLVVGSFIAGIISAWILFVAIYIVVPNQRISFRNSWLGALVAAVLVQLYLTFFPLYVTHFLKNYTGSAGAAGFAIILLLFLYYFAVILLLGAEINAYFAEGIRATPENIPTMVHQLTSHLPTSEPEIKEQPSRLVAWCTKTPTRGASTSQVPNVEVPLVGVLLVGSENFGMIMSTRPGSRSACQNCDSLPSRCVLPRSRAGDRHALLSALPCRWTAVVTHAWRSVV